MLKCLLTILLSALLTGGCSSVVRSPAANNSNTSPALDAEKPAKALRGNIRKIEPFFKPMGKPAAYDWLASHNEPGQTFDEYLAVDPVKPTPDRQKIYVLPLGDTTV